MFGHNLSSSTTLQSRVRQPAVTRNTNPGCEYSSHPPGERHRGRPLPTWLSGGGLLKTPGTRRAHGATAFCVLLSARETPGAQRHGGRTSIDLTRLSLGMTITNIHEAKTHFSKLVERVEAGEEITIARAGKPIARLVKYVAPPKPVRKPGTMKGKIKILPGFNEMDKEIEALFRGKQR